jgi:acyl transferase domain-containing protein
MALAGGVSVRVPHKEGYLYEEGGMTSPDERCRSFDAQAQGTVFTSGLGIVVLKRLADALANGDHIAAVIKGSAINNDGALKVGYTAPSIQGQAQVIEKALAQAGVAPETVSYVEAHGTATPLGDPIEVTALTQAFQAVMEKETSSARPGWCALGSVKSNIGHLDAAAGVAGVLKTVLALQHGQLPPTLHFRQANPRLDFANSPFRVNDELIPWEANGYPRRAGVSSFGIGGTNAHLLLEEAPLVAQPIPNEESLTQMRPWQLIILSAKTKSALEQQTEALATYLHQHPDLCLADVAYTLQVGRHAFSHRRFLVCQDSTDAATALATADPTRLVTALQETPARSVVFLFPGQGSQYVGMGQDLYQNEPIFRSQVDHCADVLQSHLGLDLRQVLYPALYSGMTTQEASHHLGQTRLTQPALFVLEYALATLWLSWGIQPQAFLGHSLGEYVAACLAGVFSLEDALALIALRGHLMQQTSPGAMLIGVNLSQNG